MRRDVDVAIVGAGAVGLACAAELARARRSVMVLERHAAVGLEASTHNSQVLHAGLHDPPASWKAQLCVEGRRAIEALGRRRGLPQRRIGKFVVASDASELPALEALLERGRENGVEGLALLGREALCEREPELRAVAALHCPASGIVDAMALLRCFEADATDHAAQIALRHTVEEITRVAGGWRIGGRAAGGETFRLDCAAVVNAAGLGAQRIAERAGFDPDACGYRLHACRGDYFALAPGRRLALRHLVYPLPEPGGLGIHATLDRAGRIRFGPDVDWQACAAAPTDPAKAESFARRIRRYLPALRADWLTPDSWGLRPKRATAGAGFRDFVVREESAAGFPGFVNCLGIESPGLTASPAIARRVAALLRSL